MLVEHISSPAIHILHAHYYIPRVVEECTVEGNDIRRSAVVHNVQFSNYLLPNVLFRLYMYDLSTAFSRVYFLLDQAIEIPFLP